VPSPSNNKTGRQDVVNRYTHLPPIIDLEAYRTALETWNRIVSKENTPIEKIEFIETWLAYELEVRTPHRPQT
jgi:hypothetical protein